jgi:hypothetical protein
MERKTHTEEQFLEVRGVLSRCVGREGALTIEALTLRCCLNGRRQCEQILEERLADFPFPLVSGAKGYWIPVAAEDVNQYLDSLGGRALALFRRRRLVVRKALSNGFRRCGKRFENPPGGQMELRLG